MNDFTKEELKTIKYWCRENHELVNKLQSMIDNYCEHEWQESIHDSDINICIKCGSRKLWTEFKNDNQ